MSLCVEILNHLTYNDMSLSTVGVRGRTDQQAHEDNCRGESCFVVINSIKQRITQARPSNCLMDRPKISVGIQHYLPYLIRQINLNFDTLQRDRFNL